VHEHGDEPFDALAVADPVAVEPELTPAAVRGGAQFVPVRGRAGVRERRVEPLEVGGKRRIFGRDVEIEAQRVERTRAVQAQRRRLGATCTAR
jgi:hypothetical protein